jgi:coproporphyrinogen III oxidase-like Fe-S oxidoreductase
LSPEPRDVGPAPPFGVYVHIPFCASRCDYCAFATWTDRDHLMEDYARACVLEIRRAIHDEDLPPASSVFVGGGTPSRLPAHLMAEVLGAVPRYADAEVTAECNPEDASPERFARWRDAGVNRVSFGVQSMVPHVLEGLGRRHGTTQVARAMALAGEAGFGSLNVDLILGAATETDADVAVTVEAVLGLDPRPAHVTRPAIPTTTWPPAAMRWWTQPCRRPITDGTRCRTGPSPATNAGTTRCTGLRVTTAA